MIETDSREARRSGRPRAWSPLARLSRALVPAALAATASAIALVPACSLGEGHGTVTGTLDVADCWSGRFDLAPDFFAGIPYRDTLELRIQRGSDFQTFSDGIVILVNDVHAIRPGRGPGRLGEPLSVSLPPEVTPPGVPVPAIADPAMVTFALYLQRSCRTQNVTLYAAAEALLDPDGTCADVPDGGPLPELCPGGNATDGGPAPAGDAGLSAADLPIGRSTITFTRLFNAVPEETNAAERLNEGSFDVYLVDPRETCPGGLGPPPRCRGHLTGTFRFYFERGRPAQPFP